jgi:gliding motility-associated-like protein
MKNLLFVWCLLFSLTLEAQLTATNNCGQLLTTYTNGAQNDTMFVYYEGTAGQLTAESPSGSGPFNFFWQVFNASSNSWSTFSQDLSVTTSTISNLQPGAYRVSIFDQTNQFIQAYRAWVVQLTGDPSAGGGLQVNISADCNSVDLWVDFLPGTSVSGTITPHYNLPNEPFILDATSTMSVCFSGSHSWVSDLGFFIIGPPSCGSPVLAVAPNPGSIGLGATCNLGNNFSNLCFSTNSTTNFNVCTAPTPLSGTYGSYGGNPTPINWSLLYGCDVNAGGWAVQVFDCIGLDTGALTDATLSFNGTNALGEFSSVSYTTPAGFSSPITDNSCSQASASIFQVGTVQAVPINYTAHYEWNADPYVFIADSLDNLSISLPSPTVPTVFSLDLVFLNAAGEYVNNVDSTYNDLWQCGGALGVFNNTVDFTPIPPTVPQIFGPASVCQDEIVILTSDYPGGVWSGGSINPTSGQVTASVGMPAITYTVNEECFLPANFVVAVTPFLVETYTTDLGDWCVNAGPFDLIPTGPNATFSGSGVLDFGGGASFDPALTGSIPAVYTLFESGGDPATCYAYSHSYTVNLLPVPTAVLTPVPAICESSALVNLTSNFPGIFSGPGVSANTFSPSTAGPGTFTLDFIAPNSCNATAVMTVVVGELPIISIDVPELICLSDAPFNLTASTAGGTWSGDGITNASTGFFNPTTSGSGSHTITYVTSGICPTVTTAQVIVTPNPSPNAGSDVTICEVDEVMLSVPNVWDAVLWNTGETTNAISVATAGTYLVTVELNGCFGSDNVQVAVTPMPAISIGPDYNQVCEGSTITLFAPVTGDWSNTTSGASAAIGTEGFVSFIWPNSGCPVYDTVFVDVIEFPVLDMTEDVAICPGDSILIESGYNGSWSFGGTGSEIWVSVPDTYFFTGVNEICSVTDSVVVSWLSLPIADLPESLIGCIDEPLFIDASNDVNDAYAWSTSEDTPFISVLEPGIYEVVTSNSCGEAVDEVQVFFQDCNALVFIPNAFTPDGDGTNDVWFPVLTNIESFEIAVFDRWGNVVHQSNTIGSVWTGGINSGDHFAPDGVYHYQLKYTTEQKAVVVKTGSIVLLR